MSNDRVTGRLLDLEYAIDVDVPALRAHLADVLRDSQAPVGDPVEFALRLERDDVASLTIDGRPVERGAPGWILSMMFWHLNRRVVEATPHRLLLHAAGVATSGATALVVGASSAGKTSAALGLARRGFHYLTDDVVVVEPDGSLRGSAKPVGIRPSTWALLGASEDVAPVAPHPFNADGTRQVAASTLDAALIARADPPSVIVFLAEPDDGHQPGTARPLRRSLAVARLIEATFDPGAVGDDLLVTMANLVGSATCLEWARGPLDDLVEAVSAAPASSSV